MNGESIRKNERVTWVDIVKYICILFVMISHVGNNNDVSPAVLSSFYTPFFLSGFLFVSGYTFKLRKTFVDHIKRKGIQLFIPWALYSYTIIIFNNIITRHPENHDFRQELINNTLQIRRIGDEMWFILALFVAYIPFYLLVKEYERRKEKDTNVWKYGLIMSVVFIWIYYLYKWYTPVFSWGNNNLPWHIEYIPYACAFMLLGYIYKGHLEKRFESVNNWIKALVLGILYLLCVYVPFIAEYSFSLVVTDTLYNLVVQMIGVSLLVVISKLIKSNSYLSFVGQNTLNYFGLHRYTNNLLCNYVVPRFVSTVRLVASPLTAAVYAIFIGLIESVLLIWPSMFVDRFVPFIAGKGFRAHK